ncbi:twin-arginine translocase TatA/TatE family subunit [candidate division KSB1 bacterium]|nr:twin-arginine translocase TatA/TatE family subunit [candidate division KSB1 bacterium]
MLPGISMSEVMVVLVVVLIVLGPKSIPRAARRIGQWMRAARNAMDDIRDEFRDLTNT